MCGRKKRWGEGREGEGGGRERGEGGREEKEGNLNFKYGIFLVSDLILLECLLLDQVWEGDVTLYIL